MYPPQEHTLADRTVDATHTSIFFLTCKPFNLTQTWRLCPIPVSPLNLGTKVDLDDNVWGTQNWRGGRGGQQWGCGVGSKGGVETKICARKLTFAHSRLTKQPYSPRFSHFLCCPLFLLLFLSIPTHVNLSFCLSLPKADVIVHQCAPPALGMKW